MVLPDTVVERAPQVRCHVCGSTVIFAVCHHCQKPMCEPHAPMAFREAGTLVRTPRGSAEYAKAASREFAGLKLSGTKEAVYHCPEHEHVVRGDLLGLIITGGVVAVLGIVVLIFMPLPGLVVLLIGAAIAGLAFFVRRQRQSAARESRQPLPLIPHLNSVEIVERLSGNVRLENGNYTSTKEDVAGEIKVDLSTSDGRKLLQLYRQKYKLGEADAVAFTAGNLMIQGEAGLTFARDQPTVLVSGTGLSMKASSADHHPLFPDDPERGLGEWTLKVGYELRDDRAPKHIPLWIVPSLVPSSDRRILEVDLHWNPLGPQARQLNLERFDRIELKVPPHWGNVQSVYPPRAGISESDERRVITWRNLRPDDDNSRTRIEGSKSFTLQMKFERSITEEHESPTEDAVDVVAANGHPSRLELSGVLEASFGGMLSGITGLGLYLPGGGPLDTDSPDIKPRTKVTVRFDISLNGLRYQDDRVIPDENNFRDRRLGRNKVKEYLGVVPDYATVTELTNAISADDYYVKSVVEVPPYRDDGRPNVVNRVWDISGRFYDGIFPVDFYINLRGEEVGQRSPNTVFGRTFAQVTVKGAYARTLAADSDADDDPGEGLNDEVHGELLERIENTWARLQDKVREILDRKASFTGGAPAITTAGDGDADFVAGEPVEPDQESDFSTVVVDVDVVDAEPVDAEPVAEPAAAPSRPSGVEQHLTALRDRRRAADEAVVMGRISEETHRGIIARIEEELREMGVPS